jgi:hypothetical protein
MEEEGDKKPAVSALDETTEEAVMREMELGEEAMDCACEGWIWVDIAEE